MPLILSRCLSFSLSLSFCSTPADADPSSTILTKRTEHTERTAQRKEYYFVFTETTPKEKTHKTFNGFMTVFGVDIHNLYNTQPAYIYIYDVVKVEIIKYH